MDRGQSSYRGGFPFVRLRSPGVAAASEHARFSGASSSYAESCGDAGNAEGHGSTRYRVGRTRIGTGLVPRRWLFDEAYKVPFKFTGEIGQVTVELNGNEEG